jgi:WD40 repeat protein
VVGTPQYMAPEQAKGKADAQSDVYGVGAILYEMMTGRPPFVGETTTAVLLQVVNQEPVWPRKLNPTLPEDAQAIILRALEKEKKRRYGTVREFLEDLEAYAQGNPLRHARRPTLTYVLGKKIRKQPLLWGFGTAMIAAILGGLGFGAFVLAEKARVEREGREKAEAERREANRRLAQNYILRGRFATDAGDEAAAVVFHAEANAVHPSTQARANAAAALQGMPSLDAVATHGDAVTAVAFSPDEKRIATGSADTTASVWDAETGRRIGKPCPHRLPLEAVAFSPDGMRLRTRSGGALREWEAGSGNPVEGAEGKPQPEGIPSRDGTWLLREGPGPVYRVVDARNGNEIGAPVQPGEAVARWAASPDLAWLVTARADGLARVWDMRTGRVAPNGLKLPAETLAVAVRGDGRQVAAGGRDKRVTLWSVDTGQPLDTVIRHDGWVTSLEFSLSGRKLVAGSYAGTVRVWRLPDQDPCVWVVKESPVLMGRVGDIVGMTADGRRLAMHSLGTVMLCDAATAVLLGGAYRFSGVNLRCANFSPDGAWLATAGDNNEVILSNGRTLELLPQSVQYNGPVTAAAFSGDGKRLAIGSSNNTAILWSLEGRKQVYAVNLESPVTKAAFSPDGKRIALGTSDRGAFLLDAASGGVSGKPMPHAGPVRTVMFSPDGGILASASDDRSVRLWDAGTGEPRGEPLLHVEPVSAAAFSPDGQAIATACADGSVRIWDVSSREIVGRVLVHPPGGIVALAFSLDPRRLLVALRSSVYSWDAGFLEARPDADFARGRVQKRAGLRFNERGDIEPIPAEAWKALD